MVIGKRDLLQHCIVCIAALFVVILACPTARAEMPEHARNIVIKHIGQAFDPQTRRVVDGYAILDYRQGHAKPDHAGGPKNDGGGTSTCFTVLAKGASWISAEEYIIDLSGSGLPDLALAEETFESAAIEWNVTAGGEVFGQQHPGVSTGTIGAAMNTINEVDFGPIDEPGVIAVTYVWGVFYGPPQGRYLAEWDMRFDNVDFVWTMDGSPAAMDFENIAQHELGHALGLGHPDSSCTEETMYAFATEGETKKRDLHDGDVAGAQALY